MPLRKGASVGVWPRLHAIAPERLGVRGSQQSVEQAGPGMACGGRRERAAWQAGPPLRFAAPL